MMFCVLKTGIIFPPWKHIIGSLNSNWLIWFWLLLDYLILSLWSCIFPMLGLLRQWLPWSIFPCSLLMTWLLFLADRGYSIRFSLAGIWKVVPEIINLLASCHQNTLAGGRLRDRKSSRRNRYKVIVSSRHVKKLLGSYWQHTNEDQSNLQGNLFQRDSV